MTFKNRPLTSMRSYMVRAHYSWMVDNELTPHLLVDAHYPNIGLPEQFVQDGQVVFNLSPEALGDLSIEMRQIQFTASFSGVVQTIVIPIEAVLGVYALETGEGLMFDPNEVFYWPEPSSSSSGSGHLTLVD